MIALYKYFSCKNRPAWYFHGVSDLFKKQWPQKSLAIHTDGVSFQIILAFLALTAIWGHFTA